MACRVARSFQNHAQMEPVCCCECGSTNLEVFSTSKTLGPHLCLAYALSMIECEIAKTLGTEPVRWPFPPVRTGRTKGRPGHS